MVPAGDTVGGAPADAADAPTDDVLETDFATNQVNGPGIAVYGAYQARLAVQLLTRLTWDGGMAGLGSARVATVAGHGDQVRISFPTTVDYHFVLGGRTLTCTTERQSSFVLSRATGRWLIVDWHNTDKVISMMDSGAAVQVPARST